MGICAIPGFLYVTEAMVISKSTVKELEKIQHLVALFILQLPPSSSQVGMDGGRLATHPAVLGHKICAFSSY